MKNYFIASAQNIDLAIEHLEQNKLIIHSTDTIPGLAADATSNIALKSLIKLRM